MRKKIMLPFLVLFLSVGFAFAQNTVTGNVKDVIGENLPGVNIQVKGTNQGTASDFDGNYEITASQGDVLIFSFLGFTSKELTVDGNSINVILDEDSESLDEIILTGYGMQRKSDITGSIASVKTKDLAGQPVGDAASLLQGRASGVRVVQNSGAPGSGTTVTIRGISTVNNSSPIYVVDGIFLSSIDHINPSDIANVEVLKDASATAIYGSRGANGVILVTTKKGNTEKISVNIEAMSGIQSVWKSPDLMSSEDWLATTKTARENGGFAFQEPSVPSDNVNKTTDWYDAVTTTGIITKLNATISRGDEKSNTLFSAGYFNNKGTIIGSDYERINVRLNSNYNLSEMFRVGINLGLSTTETNGIVSGGSFSGVLLDAQRMDPLTSIYDPRDGEFASSIYNDIRNPVAFATRDTRLSNSLLILMNTYLEFEPIENLVFKTSFSANLSRSKSKSYFPVYNYSQGGESRPNNSISKGFSEFNGYLTENTLNYTLNPGKHSINVMVGFTAEQNLSEYLSASKDDIANDSEELQYLDGSTNKESVLAFNSGVDTRLYSYLGRLNYNYDDRYFLTASIRRDGSSKFGPESRFATFPSLSLGWKLSNEEFMGFVSEDVLSHMMIRAGWGQVGNSNIAPYGFSANLLDREGLLEYSYIFGDQEVPGLAPVEIANKNLQWETVESTNIGLDLGFYNNKLTFSFDWFKKDTEDMIVGVPIPQYSGYYRSPQVNAGNMSNEGFEMNLAYNGTFGDDFSYGISGNLSHVTNKLENLAGGSPYVFGSATSPIGSVRRAEEGEEYGFFYGYEVVGVFQTQEEADNSAQSNVGAGDFEFRDQPIFNEETGEFDAPDGVLNANDRVNIGSPYPDFIYGLNLTARYKGFDMSLFFQGEHGKDIFNSFKYVNYSTQFQYALANDFKNHWTPENGSNSLFGLNAATESGNLKASSYYIEDGSYFRLKNLQIGYTLRNSVEWLDNTRIYLSGQNVFTITDYSGLDPEVGSTGIDIGIYPQSRIWSLGINMSF